MMFKFTRIIDALFKARGHKYLKRIPYESRGKLRYRYIYKITHTHKGKHAFHEDHLVEGTKFALSTQSGEEFHGHITSVDGDKIKYVIDDGPRKGEEVTTTREKLAKELHEKHDVHASLKGEREEVERQLAYARKKGYEKQEARLLRRLDALKPKETKKPEPEPEKVEASPTVAKEFDVAAIQDAIDNGKDLSPVFELLKQFHEKLDAGLVSPEILKESLRLFETMIEKPLNEILRKKKKDILLSYIYNNISAMSYFNLKREKKQASIDKIMNYFLLGVVDVPSINKKANTYTFMLGNAPKETRAERIKRLVSEYSQEDANKDLEDLGAKKKERTEKEEEAQKEEERILRDPQTAADYQKLRRIKNKRNMKITDADLIGYNDAYARERRAERFEDAQKKQAQKPQKQVVGDFESFETKHTKTGKDLFITRPLTRVDRDEYRRLLSEAKGLGGYYSKYSSARGFVFPTAEARDEFIAQNAAGDAGEASDPKPQKDKRKQKRDELRERLASHIDKANEELNRDRRTNTARRARMARYATDDAYSRIEYAQTQERILNAIDEGRAEHLQEITTLADLSMLNSIVNRIKHEDEMQRLRAPGNTKSYEQHRDEVFSKPVTQSALELNPFYPDRFGLWDSDLKTLRSYLTRSDGTARRGARFVLRTIDAELRTGSSMKRKELTLEDIVKIKGFIPPEVTASKSSLVERIDELIRDNARMKRLNINDRTELKAAIRQLEDLKYQLSPEEEKVKQEAEREKAAREAAMKRGDFARMNIPSYFPTPKKIIDKMIDLANISDGETVLEPSAGAGHILDELRNTGANVSAIEFNGTLREYLDEQGHNVVGNDALAHQDQYDHVVMNPPFEKQADIDHVTHAFNNNLVDGGRLVAVMSSSAVNRDNAKARAFKELLETHGYYEELPAGSFKESDRQTGVNTVLVVLDKPVHAMQKSFRYASFIDDVLRGIR